MTYEQYWYGDVWMVGAFREAEKLRLQKINAQAHLQGAYFYEALCDVAPILHAFAKKGTKAQKYPQKPYELYGAQSESKKEEQNKQKEDREEKERLFAKVYMNQMFNMGKSWGK